MDTTLDETKVEILMDEVVEEGVEDVLTEFEDEKLIEILPEEEGASSFIIEEKSVPRKRDRSRRSDAFNNDTVKSSKSSKHPIDKDQQAAERVEQERLMFEMKLLRCDQCHDELDSFKDLQRHMRTDHQIVNAYILCCDRKFGRAYAHNHMKYHQDPDAFKCDECEKVYLSQHKLDKHKTHAHVKPEMVVYNCEHCGKGFVDKWAFHGHQKSHLAPEDRMFKCEHCEYSCNTSTGLVLHVKNWHTRELEHICEVCGKGFTNIYRLRAHMKRSHEEIATEQCDLCHKFYFNVRLHKERMHFNTEEVRCELCPYQGTKLKMIVHRNRFHREPEELQCPKCDKVYKTKRSLKEHLNGHLGIKLQCHFCAVMSTSSGNWHNHMTQKHPEEYAKQKADRLATQFTKARVKNKKC